MSSALAHINESVDREQLLCKAVSGRCQAKKTKHGPVREWLLRVNNGNKRVWEVSQFPDLRTKFSFDASYREDMIRKGISWECFWKCNIEERDGAFCQIPDIQDMKRAIAYVTRLVNVGELRETTLKERAHAILAEAMEEDQIRCGPIPQLPPSRRE